jgi:hypothetical protein
MGILQRVVGKSYWHSSSPTYYELTQSGEYMKKVMAEQAAASPSMAALMAE